VLGQLGVQHQQVSRHTRFRLLCVVGRQLLHKLRLGHWALYGVQLGPSGERHGGLHRCQWDWDWHRHWHWHWHWHGECRHLHRAA
jgi:hypothetical protein